MSTGKADKVVVTVVVWLGVIATALSVGYVLLLRDVIHQAANKGPIDPAAIAAIAALGPLVGAAVSQLGSLLSTTRSHETPQEVTVENTPLPVDDEAGHTDVSVIVVAALVAFVVVILVNEVIYNLSL